MYNYNELLKKYGISKEELPKKYQIKIDRLLKNEINIKRNVGSPEKIQEENQDLNEEIIDGIIEYQEQKQEKERQESQEQEQHEEEQHEEEKKPIPPAAPIHVKTPVQKTKERVWGFDKIFGM